MAREEMQCEGPCSQWLSIYAFTKASRSKGGRQWCIKCVSWTEADEHGITPLPAPSNQRSIEEYALYRGSDHYRPAQSPSRVQPNVVKGQRNGNNSLYDDDFPQGSTGPTSMFPADNTTTTRRQAPHQLLPSLDYDDDDDDLGGGGYRTESAPSDTYSTTTGGSGGRQQQLIRKQTQPPKRPLYNSYGPNGEVGVRTGRPSQTSTAASSVVSFPTTASYQDTNSRGAWAKPRNNRRTVVAAPAYIREEDPERIRQARDYDWESDDEP